MFGIHLTVTQNQLSELAELRRKNQISCPEGVNIVAEYVWDRKYLIILVESDDLASVKTFANLFTNYGTALEIGEVTTLGTLDTGGN